KAGFSPKLMALSALGLGATVGTNAARGKNLAKANDVEFTGGDVAKATLLPFVTPESIVKRKLRKQDKQKTASELLEELEVLAEELDADEFEVVASEMLEILEKEAKIEAASTSRRELRGRIYEAYGNYKKESAKAFPTGKVLLDNLKAQAKGAAIGAGVGVGTGLTAALAAKALKKGGPTAKGIKSSALLGAGPGLIIGGAASNYNLAKQQTKHFRDWADNYYKDPDIANIAKKRGILAAEKAIIKKERKTASALLDEMVKIALESEE
ncbi:MAG TPA: hypothetical protein PKK61_05540, partial [Defluviitaleaceae bacterium]|nr:hypothetical protein [Defluviitaleaceae bacterium]